MAPTVAQVLETEVPVPAKTDPVANAIKPTRTQAFEEEDKERATAKVSPQ